MWGAWIKIMIGQTTETVDPSYWELTDSSLTTVILHGTELSALKVGGSCVA